MAEISPMISDDEVAPQVAPRSRWGVAGGVAGGLALGVLGMAAISHQGSSSVQADVSVATGFDMIKIKPPRAQCSKTGTNCASTGCCELTGYSCYKKAEGNAGCLKTSTCGMKKGQVDSTGWDCSELRQEVYAEVRTYNPGLFCFEVALRDVGPVEEPNHDIEIVQIQAQAGVSVFGEGCAEWAVYSDEEWPVDPENPSLGKSIVVDAPHIGTRKTGAWINSPVFMNVWKDIGAKQTYANYEFTVKVDPDAVFFPYMLTTYLAHKPLALDSLGTYIVNCRFVKDGFFGSLEVISQDAVTNYVKSMDTCAQTLAWKTKGKEYGEDKFAEKCFEQIGIQATEDYTLNQDNLCKAIEDRAKEAKATGVSWKELNLKKFVKKHTCDNRSAIAFHPVKQPEEYRACIKTYQNWE